MTWIILQAAHDSSAMSNGSAITSTAKASLPDRVTAGVSVSVKVEQAPATEVPTEVPTEEKVRGRSVCWPVDTFYVRGGEHWTYFFDVSYALKQLFQFWPLPERLWFAAGVTLTWANHCLQYCER